MCPRLPHIYREHSATDSMLCARYFHTCTQIHREHSATDSMLCAHYYHTYTVNTSHRQHAMCPPPPHVHPGSCHSGRAPRSPLITLSSSLNLCRSYSTDCCCRYGLICWMVKFAMSIFMRSSTSNIALTDDPVSE